MRRLMTFAIALSLLTSCQYGKDENVLAQVGESKLMLRDVLEQMPLSYRAADSALFVDDYVGRWVEEELLFHQGVRHLDNYPELMEQVEAYKRTLVMQSYQRELLQQHVQEVSDEECRVFYEKYQSQMKLSTSLVKGFYVKLPEATHKHKQLKDWLKQLKEGNTDHMEEIEQYCQLRATDYDGFLDTWYPLSYVSNRLPVQVVDAPSFLRLQLYEMNEDGMDYLLLLTDYRLDGEVAPFEYVLPEIREMLLTQHSREFLKQSYEAMREQALGSGLLHLKNNQGNQSE